MNKPGWLPVGLASGLCAMLAALLNPWLAPVAALAVAIALSPLARKKRLWFVGDVESDLAVVSRRREEALRALKDLDDDRNSGKISQEAFERQRPILLDTARQVTAQFNQMQNKRNEARKRIEDILADHGSA